MMNVICMQGRLVADPEMRQTQSGKAVASIRIACDRGRKDAQGNTQTDFFDCVAWDKSADFVYKYFHKGDMIMIDGRLQTRKYQTQDGSSRTATEIVCQNINFGGSAR